MQQGIFIENTVTVSSYLELLKSSVAVDWVVPWPRKCGSRVEFPILHCMVFPRWVKLQQEACSCLSNEGTNPCGPQCFRERINCRDGTFELMLSDYLLWAMSDYYLRSVVTVTIITKTRDNIKTVLFLTEYLIGIPLLKSVIINKLNWITSKKFSAPFNTSILLFTYPIC